MNKNYIDKWILHWLTEDMYWCRNRVNKSQGYAIPSEMEEVYLYSEKEVTDLVSKFFNEEKQRLYKYEYNHYGIAFLPARYLLLEYVQLLILV